MGTEEKNTKCLKKIAKGLGGKYHISVLNKFSFIWEMTRREKKYHYMALRGHKIPIERYGLYYSGRGKKFKKEKSFLKEVKKLLFTSCGHILPAITIRHDGKILGCGNSESFDNKLNIIGDVKNKNLKEILNHPRKKLFNQKFHHYLTLIKFYLSAKNLNDKKINHILKSKYSNKCQFCLTLRRTLDMKKLKPVKNYQVFLFLVKNLHWYLLYTFWSYVRGYMYLDLIYRIFKYLFIWSR